MILFRLYLIACLKAKASEEKVLHPPVGTVRENRPGLKSAASRQFFNMVERCWLTLVAGAQEVIWFKYCERFFSNTSSSGYPPRRHDLSGSIKNSVSRKSASTRQEQSIRIKNESWKQTLFVSFLFKNDRSDGSVCLRISGRITEKAGMFFCRRLVRHEVSLVFPSGSPA